MTTSATPWAGQIIQDGVGCHLEGAPDPCVVVIFGASGDLCHRKLMPALYDLFVNHGLGERLAVVGCARTDYDDDQFRGLMAQAVTEAGLDLAQWDAFARRLFYQPLTYDDPASFAPLRRRLEVIDRDCGGCGNRIYNLAIPPQLHAAVARSLSAAGMSQSDGPGWLRLVVEKPFGDDLQSARQLNAALAEGFAEEQIFRIDHYLAKDTVQNLMLFRFANAVFEPLWDRKYVDFVAITAAETLGVEHRAGYYEQAGVLRDMFQNHMLQLLALVAGEAPPNMDAERVRDEKARLFRCLQPLPADNLDGTLVLGQYAAGRVAGQEVVAYRDEPGVASGSLTPTFAAMRVFVDNWRWQGVPFYLCSGKRLAKKRTSIDIQFKQVPHSLFRQALGEHITSNRLSLGIQPEETITLSIQTKKPGPKLCLRTVGMGFDFRAGGEPMHDAYEKVLLDAMLGDHTLFWRQDGVELCWQWLEPLLRACEACADRGKRLHFYPAGGWGPPQARGLAPLLADRNED